MSGFRASLMSQELSAGRPESVAGRLNEFLVRSVQPGRFVTAFLGFLDAATGRLAYVNAGHNPPFVLRADGSHETLIEGGTILGLMPDAPFTHGESVLATGDLVALYTDGVTEGADPGGEMWGQERLLAALRAGRHRPCRDLVAGIAAEVRAFEGAQGPADDITLLLARRIGSARRARPRGGVRRGTPRVRPRGPGRRRRRSPVPTRGGPAGLAGAAVEGEAAPGLVQSRTLGYSPASFRRGCPVARASRLEPPSGGAASPRCIVAAPPVGPPRRPAPVAVTTPR
jgi:hypothetical protein